MGTLEANLGAAANTRSGYFAAVIPAVAFMDNPLVAAACRPTPAAQLRLSEFLRRSGTVYVVAGDDPRVAPLLTALTEAVFAAAKELAATQPGGRLSTPLGLFLDEVVNITPVPLDVWAADSRGWGITVCAAAQDLAQLESRWAAAQTIYANLPTKVVLLGVANTTHLEALAYLAGSRRVRQTSDGDSTTGGGRSRSLHCSWVREPVITGALIYSLPRWHAYVLGLGPRPVVVRFQPGHRRTDPADRATTGWRRLLASLRRRRRRVGLVAAPPASMVEDERDNRDIPEVA